MIALRNTNKWVDAGTHCFFALLFVLAVLSYQERLFADSGYYLFRIVNTGGFWIEHGRYVLALSQLFPLAGTWVGLPLHSVLILYSVGHVLFFYGIFLIARYAYHDYTAGPFIILIQTLGIISGYFAPMFELYYGAALLGLFAAILYSNRRNHNAWILLIITEVIILTSHPMAFGLVVLVMLFHWLDSRQRGYRLYGILTAILLLVATMKFFSVSDYEQARSEQVLQVIRENPLGFEYWSSIGSLMLQLYIPLLILLAGTLYVLVRSKTTMKWILLAGGALAALFLATLQNYGSDHTRYQEQAYFTLSVITAYTFIRYVPPAISPRWRGVLFVITGLLISYKMFLIRQEHMHFHRRVQTMERLISHVQLKPGRKFVVAESNVTKRAGPGPNWSYPIETLLLSSESNHIKPVTICLDTDLAVRGNASALTPGDYLFRRWEIYPLERLNPEYFVLDSSEYEPLNAPVGRQDSISHLFAQVQLTIDKAPATMRADRLYFLPVTLRNHSSESLISSIGNDLYLSYHWFRGDEASIWEGLRTPLEVDVEAIYAQEIEIQAPAEAGKYTLTLDLVAEGRGWFNIDCSIDITIR